MASQARETFAADVDPELLSVVRKLAESEGRQFQALVAEAFSDLIEKRRQAMPRGEVMEIYRSSHERFGPLYKKLAE